MRTTVSICAALLVHGALPLSALAGSQTPGLWSMETTLVINGRPQSMPAVRECISAQDFADPIKTLPRPDGKCSLTNVDRTSERATYDIACMNGGLTTTGRADLRFGENRYAGSVVMQVTDKGGPGQAMTMTITAQRVGDCTK